jgi:histidine triad (HIT) family protein
MNMNKKEDCLFCKIVAGEVPSHKVYEDENTYVFLDIFPVGRGHMLIIPKDHAEDLGAGSVEAACDMMKTVHTIAPGVMKALGATGYNLGMNHGSDAGQIVWHTHIHFIPRYAGQERSFEKHEANQDELAELGTLLRAAF